MSRGAKSSTTANVTVYRRDYPLLSDMKYIYSVKLLQTGRTLLAMDERLYDQMVGLDTPSTPTHYTLFPQGERALLRLVPTPVAEDTLLIKYFRRMTVPSSGGETLDIPQDYENYIISLAKGLYLMDKGADEKSRFHWQLGLSGLAQARAADNRVPDMDQGFIPGNVVPVQYGPNSVWPYLDPW